MLRYSISIKIRPYRGVLTAIRTPGNPPNTFELLPSFPNPFNSSVTIRQRSASPTTIKIYAINGRLIKTLRAFGAKNADTVFSWDGTDESGRAMASGIFMLRIETDAGVYFRKITLLR